MPMHSPSAVVFDLMVPVPNAAWKVLPGTPRYILKRRRYTCPEDEDPLCGEAIYPWWRPAAWGIAVAGRVIKWTDVATVWHVEPDDKDSGDICKGMRGTEFCWHNIRWAIKHRAHCEIHWRHYRRARSWLFDRCERCGLPFRGNYRGRNGTWGSEEVYHNDCYYIMVLEDKLNYREEI